MSVGSIFGYGWIYPLGESEIGSQFHWSGGQGREEERASTEGEGYQRVAAFFRLFVSYGWPDRLSKLPRCRVPERARARSGLFRNA